MFKNTLVANKQHEYRKPPKTSVQVMGPSEGQHPRLQGKPRRPPGKLPTRRLPLIACLHPLQPRAAIILNLVLPVFLFVLMSLSRV